MTDVSVNPGQRGRFTAIFFYLLWVEYIDDKINYLLVWKYFI